MKRTIAFATSAFLLVFYMIIILYVQLGVIHIEELENFAAGIIFEFIGFLFLVAVILGGFIAKSVKVGFYVPLVMVTVIYTILLNILNLACIGLVAPVIFVLIHLVLLFIYCLVSIPMFVMMLGKR